MSAQEVMQWADEAVKDENGRFVRGSIVEISSQLFSQEARFEDEAEKAMDAFENYGALIDLCVDYLVEYPHPKDLYHLQCFIATNYETAIVSTKENPPMRRVAERYFAESLNKVNMLAPACSAYLN